MEIAHIDERREMSKQDKDISMTGDRPTGPLHLGHYVGSLLKRVELQDSVKQFVMIADVQAMTDHVKEPQMVQQNVWEVLADYLAVGIDPKKSVIFLQSQIPALFEMTVMYLNFVTWNRLKHNPTVKKEITQKAFKEGVPAGFMVYPVSQAADITAFRANLVPVGEDQKPMIEQTHEIVRAFNRTYDTDVLVSPQAVMSKMTRLSGLDGKTKMSKSLGNAIFLKDDAKTLEKKVKKMYTDPNHLRVEDPGAVEGNTVFEYLDIFGSNREEVETLKDHYKRGGLGDGTVKKVLLRELSTFLGPLSERRKNYFEDKDYLHSVLKEGTIQARAVADETLNLMKEAMHTNYQLFS